MDEKYEIVEIDDDDDVIVPPKERPLSISDPSTLEDNNDDNDDDDIQKQYRKKNKTEHKDYTTLRYKASEEYHQKSSTKPEPPKYVPIIDKKLTKLKPTTTTTTTTSSNKNTYNNYINNNSNNNDIDIHINLENNNFIEVDDDSDSDIKTVFKPSGSSGSSKDVKKRKRVNANTNSSNSTATGSKQQKEKKKTKNDLLEELELEVESQFAASDRFKSLTLDLPIYCKITTMSSRVKNSIKFVRQGYSIFDQNSSSIPSTDRFIVVLYPVEDFCEKVLAGEDKLLKEFQSYTKFCAGYRFSIIVEKLDNYMKQRSQQIQSQLNKNRNDISSISDKPVLTKELIDSAIVPIQLELGFTFRFINAEGDTVIYLTKLHETIANLPNQTDDSLFEGFCAESIKSKGGKNLQEVWINQLSQINGMSPQMARHFASTYKSIRYLFEQFHKFDENESDFIRSLAEFKMENNRKLGPALATKIFTVFFSTDPNRTINN